MADALVEQVERFGDDRVAAGFRDDLQHQRGVEMAGRGSVLAVAGDAVLVVLDDAVHRIAGAGFQRLQVIGQQFHLARDDAVDQLRLAGEIAVDQPRAHLRGVGDHRHAGAVEAALGKTALGGVEDPVALHPRTFRPCV